MTAPANSVSMQVQYLLYQSSGWVNIDDVEVTVVAPAAASEVTKYYYFGGLRVAMRKNGVLTYLHADHPSATLGNHLGSTVLETNASGAVVNDEKYKAYGKQRDTGAVSTDHRFTGQKEDASGLQYFHARFYDPVIGMFVSPDTMVPDAGNVFDYNRFMYARGNAMKYNDPTGHFCDDAVMGSSTFDIVLQGASCVSEVISNAGDAAKALGMATATEVAVAAPAAAGVGAVAAGGAGIPILIAYSIPDAMNDMGPEYPVVEYSEGAIQGTNLIIGAATVTTAVVNTQLSMQSDSQLGGSIYEARPNTEGNRGASAAHKRDGQNSNRKDPGRNQPKQAPFDKIRNEPAPEISMDPDNILENLHPDQVGWRTWILIRTLQMIAELQGNSD